jgi:hypothetical protein
MVHVHYAEEEQTDSSRIDSHSPVAAMWFPPLQYHSIRDYDRLQISYVRIYIPGYKVE